jgi:hypothetical protein
MLSLFVTVLKFDKGGDIKRKKGTTGSKTGSSRNYISLQSTTFKTITLMEIQWQDFTALYSSLTGDTNI